MSDPPPPFHVSRAKLKELMQCKGGVNIPQKIADDFGDIKSLWNGLLTNPETGIKGDADDIAQRKAAYGVNVIRTKKPKSIWKLIWSAMNDLTLVTLMVAALVSFILAFIAPPEKSSDVVVTESHSNWIEGAAIMVSVVLVVLITAYNDHKKENQFQALKDRIDKEVKCSVIRSGQPTNVLVSDLVIGDVCQVKYGDLIPADGIIVASNDLKMDESSLTGESDHVKKDSINNPLIFSGTHVMEGSGRMVVTAVGVDSEAGNIMKMLGNVSKTKEEKAQERLQKKENEKAKKLKNRAPKVSPNSQQAVITISEAGDEANDIQMSMLNDQQVSSDDQPHGGEDGVVAGTGPSHEHDGPSQVEESDGGKSVLQMKLTKLSSSIGFAGTIIALLTVLILFTRHTIDTYLVDKQEFALSQLNDYVKHLIIGITVLVVAIPEGLPLAVTISLACSVKRMTKDNNLVRHLDACETMGNATTICSDKTGTLTTNQMTAVDAYIAAVRHLDRLPKLVDLPHKVAALLGDAITINCAYTSRITPSEVVGEPPKQMGNKTECALLGFLLDLGIDYQAIRETNPEEKLHKVYTFNSARKSMSTVIRLPDSAGFRVYTKGASEIVLKRCTYIHGKEGNLEEFTAEKQASLLKQVIEPMAEGGLRTICVAYKDYRFKTSQPNEIEISSEPDWEADECINANFTCLAIVGIEDPVRPEVPQAIRQCQDAGITVRMVTGDNLHTARSIAIKCGIVTPEDDFLVLEGRQFNERIRDINGDVRQELFDQVWPRLRVLARSSPADKYTLVKHIIASKLNTKREVVAVTGDGTNDGPALKMADVGFAMGIAGTDVAKEASDIIITDDNFSSIVKAVMWGRNVYDSIAKFLQFQLTVNVVAVVVAFVGACAIEDSPLKAVQMLWVNLIMDTFASIAMANETLSNDLLKRQPYGRKKALISKRMAVNIVGQSLYQLVVIFSILFWGHQWFDFPSALIEEHRDAGPTEHFSFIFNVFVLMTIFNEVNCRKIHGERNIAAGLLGNIYFCVIILGSIIVQVIIFLVPFCRSIFHLTALTGPQWGWSVLLGVSVLLWNQVLITIPPDSVWVCHLWRRHPAVGGAVDPAKELKSGSRSPRADGDYALRKRDLEVIVSESRLNWCRGIKRIQYQLRVMHAFQEEISRTPPLRTKNVAGPGGMVRSKTQTSMRSNVSNSNLLQSSTSPTAV